MIGKWRSLILKHTYDALVSASSCVQTHPKCGYDVQAVCEASSQPVVVQQIDSGNAQFSIRQQEFTALAPAYLGNIPVSVQQVS